MTITTRKAFKKTHSNSADKGSQLWLQLLVGETGNLWFRDSELANHIPGIIPGSIDWRSPLAPDFQEERDGAFLASIGLPALQNKLVWTPKNLTGFWPARGPVWDALAVGPNGMRILVEAKAHVAEIASGGAGARAQSKKVITAAFDQVKLDLGIRKEADWTGPLYQHANRLAHLWWLHQQGEDAHLVFLYFVNADDVGGPASAERWMGAIELEEKVLGVGKRHALRQYVHHVFFDVEPFTG